MRLLKAFCSVDELLFPPRCVFCGDTLPTGETEAARLTSRGNPLFADVPLCADCQDVFTPEALISCRFCGAFLKGVFLTNQRCSICRNWKTAVDSVTPLGEYVGVLRDAVLAAKLSKYRPLGQALALMLYHYRGKLLRMQKPDVIIPMPMHWFYHWVRGVNNPRTLADVLSQRLKVPVANLLHVTRMTLSQRSVPTEQRRQNVENLFAPHKRADLRAWEGKRALLVDDVFTTGATADAAAWVLKEQFHFSTVSVAVLARAMGHTKKPQFHGSGRI